MNLFNVYPLFDIEPVKAEGCYVWDKNGNQYLDFYGGHAVISIGHSHPHYVNKISKQVSELGFYSNSIQNPLQQELADKLGKASRKDEYSLFLCNSGAEANENALKLASFHNEKKKVISFTNSFHGRTSLAVAATDNLNIVAPINETKNTLILPFNDESALENAFKQNDICAVIIEGIQGVGGINIPEESFLKRITDLCQSYNTVFIADEVQSGYGRTGKFFAIDHYDIEADIYTMAKGMGNGFPIGGLLIHPKFKSKHGMLGTTFGGNHLACTAGISVLEIIEKEKLIKNANTMGQYLIKELRQLSTTKIKDIRGKGLMIGIELFEEASSIRKRLLFEEKVFTGSASSKNTIRLLPPLSISKVEADLFLENFEKVLK